MSDAGTPTIVKKKVLISFVGNRDPYSPKNLEEGAVLSLIRRLKPDFVFLFPTSRAAAANTKKTNNHTEGNAEKIVEILSKCAEAPKSYILPLETDRPHIAEQCYKAFKRKFDEMRTITASETEGGIDACDLFYNNSSGTQQMTQAGRLYLSIFRIPAEFWQVDDPEYLPEDSPDRIHLVPRSEEELVLMTSIDSNLDSYHFHTIMDSCRSLAERSIITERRTLAKALAGIFSAYEMLDMLDYKHAMKTLKEQQKIFKDRDSQIIADVPEENISEILSLLDRQIEYLAKSEKASNTIQENTYNLTDLFFNMIRALERGNYADVLARFWRFREGLMNYRLLFNHKINVRSLDDDFYAKKRIEEVGLGQYIKDNTYGYNNSMNARSELLQILGDKEISSFNKNNRGTLEKLQTKRNQTLVAHGMLPVKREEAELCERLGKLLVSLIPNGSNAYDDYPFEKGCMKKLVELLKV